MRELLHHPARAGVGIGVRLGHRVDRAGGDAGLLALRQPVRARAAGGDRLDERLERAAILQTLADGVEARVRDQVREIEQRREARPEVVLGGADGEVPVARAERLVRRVQPVRGAESPRDLARVPVLGGLPLAQRHARLEERRVDELAAAGDVPGTERGQDADDGEEAGAEVRDRHPDLDGRAAVAARGAHDPAHALRDEIVAAAIGVRARLAEARDRAVDQPRIDRA